MREVPDFPLPGVVFRDLTPVLADPDALRAVVDALQDKIDDSTQVIAAIESRGFLLGAALGYGWRYGVVPLRKPGKLPPPLVTVEYELEYGRDALQARSDALKPGERTLIVDDVLATGGTLAAARELVERLDAVLVGASVLIELPALNGRARWSGEAPVHSLLRY